ncbi:alpha/beta hydrolase [Mesorhizobium sp. M7A.F.Ca.US.006.01.1.1]|uniref:alpha/beta fold hydrolase n=1 Tax=Mesorhizobium sp. M7A.F.Ca.US.006.01.1.1 TaxID=2496707 RepID=UPI000FCAD336|nr:alpha/beta hydrolase [Mesorhizobium sp. M7A.F.Ca.US.006.01.1.1]RUZ70205.1 alpha/beta hydrolase [Mesorhizobium sp. M7A.F.Ca.US.006.01.1.1]
MTIHIEGFSHRIVSANGVNIHTVSGGQGSPLVLIHGFPQTWWEWRNVMSKLAEHHRVVAIDLRGAGFSDCPVSGYDKETLAEDVHQVMQELGHTSYAVCGHDIGAMVSVALASSRRDAVTRLIVLDAPLPGWTGWGQCLTSLWQFGFHQKRDLPELLIRGREFEYVSAFIAERTFDHGSYSFSDMEIFAKALALPGRTRAALEWYRAFPLDHQNALQWKSEPLRMPVLALGGEKRFGPQMIAMLEEFASDVSGGSIPDCGHYVADEKPAAVTSSILEFLA